VIFGDFFRRNMAAPLFGDEWMSKDEVEHADAYAQFQAAVHSARMSSDEGIKQVVFMQLLNFCHLYVSFVGLCTLLRYGPLKALAFESFAVKRTLSVMLLRTKRFLTSFL